MTKESNKLMPTLSPLDPVKTVRELVRWAETPEQKAEMHAKTEKLPWLKKALERVSKFSQPSRGPALFGGQQRYNNQHLVYSNASWIEFFKRHNVEMQQGLVGLSVHDYSTEKSRMTQETDVLAEAIVEHREKDAARKHEFEMEQRLIQQSIELEDGRAPKLNGGTVRGIQEGQIETKWKLEPGEGLKPIQERRTAVPFQHTKNNDNRFVSVGTNRISENIGKDYEENVVRVREYLASDPSVTFIVGHRARTFTAYRAGEVIHSVCDDRSPEEIALDHSSAEGARSHEAARAAAARETAEAERADTSHTEGRGVQNETAELLCETYGSPARNAREVAFNRNPDNWVKTERALKRDFITAERHVQFAHNPEYVRIVNEVSKLRLQGKVQDAQMAMDAIVTNTREGDLAGVQVTQKSVANFIEQELATRTESTRSQPKNSWEAEVAKARQEFDREFEQTSGAEKPDKAIQHLSHEAELMRNNPELTSEFCEAVVRGHERIVEVPQIAEQTSILQSLEAANVRAPLELLGSVSKQSARRMLHDTEYAQELVASRDEARGERKAVPQHEKTQEHSQPNHHSHDQDRGPNYDGPSR